MCFAHFLQMFFFLLVLIYEATVYFIIAILQCYHIYLFILCAGN